MKNAVYTLLMQIPLGSQNPDDNTPVDFSNPFNIIVFIIIPIIVIILYIYWKKTKNKKEE
ncbi:adenylosuccinate synthetase [Formosa sp. PL04]|uniref:adenylosuccinate synthetase n=1 Tax=Formosa sp. PL04 TaxID=3081755 RepID=UPI002981EAD9|nr:adenylosuccinate synthetase [Formosa sp. PL04]MDW5288535.1 adenylosuccinate synthetase [Formosa sp. PL04]